MFSVFSLVLLIIKPLIGRCIDRIGWKWFLVGAMIIYALAFCLLSGAQSGWILYSVRILQGIGSALLGIATYSMVISVADGNAVGRQLGRVQSTQATGMMIGALISMFVFFNVDFFKGWYFLYRMFALMSLVGAFIVAFKVKGCTKISGIKQRVKLKYSKEVIGILIITFIGALSTSMLSPILMVYLQDYFTKDLMWLSLTFLPSGILYCILGGRLGYLGDRYGYVKMMLIGMVINSATVFLIPSANHIMILGVLWCVDAIGDLIRGTSRSAFLSKAIGQEAMGEAYGICSAIGSLGAIVGPFLGGILYDKVSVSAPFYMNGIGLLLACGVMLCIIHSKKISSFYKVFWKE